jgi:aryl-alcohol dehydrogenase-like predicted oxidoreductase
VDRVSDLWPGAATDEGTAAYRERMAARTGDGHFRALGGAWLSSIGLGTYLGPDDDAADEEYRHAVARALELGLNVIDSAINYRSQRSERAIGAALKQAFADGRARRQEVVVTTKGGYLPFDGARPRNLRTYVEATYIKPGVLEMAELVAGCHCMTPRWLADQLDRSRRNLGLATIDGYYLHNPETQLGEVSRAEFLRRVRAAFAFLESAVSDGKIRWYGTATWSGYRQPRAAEDHLSLAELTSLAREVGGDRHHFRLLQLPFNLAMAEALTARNQDGRSLLEAAAQAEIYVMTSASILQGKLARALPPAVTAAIDNGLTIAENGLTTHAQRALQLVRSAPGVGTALVGMRRAAHVEENARVATVPSLPPATARSLLGG